MENKKPLIFVVSGKARAGKDTTCEFIRNYAKLKNLQSTNLQFSSYIKMYAKTIVNWDGNDDTKPRTLLQELGTDVIRKNIDELFFVNRIIGDIKVYSYYLDIITISDTRLPIEIDSLKKEFDNVVSINIERPGYESSLNIAEKNHVTETALDNYHNFDYVIINDGTLDELNTKAKKILDEVIDNEKSK